MDGDDARARVAAANNADLYAAVFAAHGLRFHRDAWGLFRAIDRPPLYYSSLTTLDPDATAQQLAAIEALQAEGRADLPASRTDLPARWRTRQPPYFVSSSKRPGSGRPRRRSLRPALPDGNASPTPKRSRPGRRRGRRPGRQPEAGFFPPRYSLIPAMAFFGRRDGSGFDSGCLCNRSAGCTGLSNIFSPGGGRPGGLRGSSGAGRDLCAGRTGRRLPSRRGS